VQSSIEPQANSPRAFCGIDCHLSGDSPSHRQPPRDALAQGATALTGAPVQSTRPEQTKTPHDNSNVSAATRAEPSSSALRTQPKAGKNSGFDFYPDPLRSDRPMENPDAIMQRLLADKPRVMEAQRKRDFFPPEAFRPEFPPANVSEQPSGAGRCLARRG
jgi:hypothetical protein